MAKYALTDEHPEKQCQMEFWPRGLLSEGAKVGAHKLSLFINFTISLLKV